MPSRGGQFRFARILAMGTSNFLMFFAWFAQHISVLIHWKTGSHFGALDRSVMISGHFQKVSIVLYLLCMLCLLKVYEWRRSEVQQPSGTCSKDHLRLLRGRLACDQLKGECNQHQARMLWWHLQYLRSQHGELEEPRCSAFGNLGDWGDQIKALGADVIHDEWVSRKLGFSYLIGNKSAHSKYKTLLLKSPSQITRVDIYIFGGHRSIDGLSTGSWHFGWWCNQSQKQLFVFRNATSCGPRMPSVGRHPVRFWRQMQCQERCSWSYDYNFWVVPRLLCCRKILHKNLWGCTWHSNPVSNHDMGISMSQNCSNAASFL